MAALNAAVHAWYDFAAVVCLSASPSVEAEIRNGWRASVRCNGLHENLRGGRQGCES